MQYVCPAKAITMVLSVDGELMLYSDREKVFQPHSSKWEAVLQDCL